MTRELFTGKTWLRCIFLLGFVGLFSLLPAATSFADTAPNISIETDQAPKPNPALVGLATNASFKVDFTDPSTGQEITPPAGTTYSWTSGPITRNGVAVSTANISFDFPSDQATGETGVFASAGDYVVQINCTVSNSNWSPSSVTPTTSYGLKVQDVVVSFSSDPIITGMEGTASSTGNTTPIPIITIVTAQVQPISEVNNISIGVAAGTQNRVNISFIQRNTTTGVITFYVTGTSGTDASQPKGDTTIVGQNAGVTEGQAQAIVIVPSSIQEPPSIYNTGGSVQNVTPYNEVINQFSTPAATPAPPIGEFYEGTNYSQNLHMTVLDQFGHALNSLYAGVPVSEDNQTNINSPLSASGQYLDAVGVTKYPDSGPALHSDSEQYAWTHTDPLIPIPKVQPPNTYSGSFEDTHSVQVNCIGAGGIDRYLAVRPVDPTKTSSNVSITVSANPLPQ